jgi:hypothetical protein
VCAANAQAEGGFVDALIGGKPDLFLRYRLELVDDATPGLKRATASTLRTAIGYATGDFRDFSAYLQLEDVRVIGNDLYNNGGENGRVDRATVVDPEGTELNQGFLRYAGVPRTVLTLGRQEITHREAPVHRYLGNILFRQNWQSFDAFRAVNLSLPSTVIDYSYIWNVNRIFGEDNPRPDASDFRMNSHALNVQHTGLPVGKLEGYAYLLDFDSEVSRRFSSATVGARLSGDVTPIAKTKVIYAAEFARQTDYADNPNNVGVNYYLGELGASYAIGGALESVGTKLGVEVLGGKGGANAFQTMLGTNHAFQGNADRFLVTPSDGIKDYYFFLTGKVLGAQLFAGYHRFKADKDGYSYGDEWDFVVERAFGQLLVGLQYADYQADRNDLNVARNSTSGQAFDLNKFWAYVQYRY